MLCRSCQNQTRCLPAQLAQADPALAALLDQLQDCQLQDRQRQDYLQVAGSDRPSFLQSLWAGGPRWWQQARQSLRRWHLRGRVGSA